MNQNRHNNLTATLSIACNMSREGQDIRNNNGLLLRGSGSANALAEANLLARGLPVEGTQKKKLVL